VVFAGRESAMKRETLSGRHVDTNVYSGYFGDLGRCELMLVMFVFVRILLPQVVRGKTQNLLAPSSSRYPLCVGLRVCSSGAVTLGVWLVQRKRLARQLQGQLDRAWVASVALVAKTVPGPP
jgi:hypothetical protein